MTEGVRIKRLEELKKQIAEERKLSIGDDRVEEAAIVSLLREAELERFMAGGKIDIGDFLELTRMRQQLMPPKAIEPLEINIIAFRCEACGHGMAYVPDDVCPQCNAPVPEAVKRREAAKRSAPTPSPRPPALKPSPPAIPASAPNVVQLKPSRSIDSAPLKSVT